jgi:ATP-dependent DNA helicase 2 subunit 2
MEWKMRNNNFRSHPITKLCEHEGEGTPKGKRPDCYQDADETDFACKEKYRIMVS